MLNSIELRDRKLARAVYALPWDDFQTPWSPLTRARLNTLVHMLEALNLNGSERVLDIGTGAGYRAALLGSLASRVYSVDLSEAIATSARQRLERAGCTNVEVIAGDGSLGWAPSAPYDAIVVGCACPEVPNQLIHQLAEGGRLLIPIGDATGQLLVRLCRRTLAVESTTVAPCALGPLEFRGERPPSSVPWQRLPGLGAHPPTPAGVAGTRSSR
jgi:protein-L-isoaspartate(D-aspartate) O-methyltransferase